MSNAQKVKALQKAYAQAKAENERVKQLTNTIKDKILKDNVFVSADNDPVEPGERITNHNGDFTMSETEFERYCKLVHTEQIKAGLDVPDWNTTEDWKTRPALRKAEDDLIDYGLSRIQVEESTKNKMKREYDIRQKMIDLAMRLDPRTV